jgi:hypothetical protein
MSSILPARRHHAVGSIVRLFRPEAAFGFDLTIMREMGLRAGRSITGKVYDDGRSRLQQLLKRWNGTWQICVPPIARFARAYRQISCRVACSPCHCEQGSGGLGS